jgi:hypothetical protein
MFMFMQGYGWQNDNCCYIIILFFFKILLSLQSIKTRGFVQMAQLSLTHSRLSLPKQLANFTNSTAGLDLTLRLLHSMALIGTEIDFDNATVMRCAVAASQIGIGGVFLRFLQ